MWTALRPESIKVQQSEHPMEKAAAVAEMQKHIEEQVQLHLPQLWKHSVGLAELSHQLSAAQTEAQSLTEQIRQVQVTLVDKRDKIRSNVDELVAIQARSKLIRQLQRLLHNSKRLEALDSDSSVKAAVLVYESRRILQQSPELVRVVCARGALTLVDRVENRCVSLASKQLEESLGALDQAGVATALQVFFNLGSLQQQVNKTVLSLQAKLTTAVASRLDMPLSKTKTKTVPVRIGFWNSMDQMFEQVFQELVRVWNLQLILSKKSDSLSGQPFLSVLDGESSSLLKNAWEHALTQFFKEFEKAFHASNFVSQTVSNEFPRLLMLAKAFFKRLSEHIPGFFASLDQARLLESFLPFRAEFLSKSLSSFNEPLSLMFASLETDSKKSRLDISTARLSVPTVSDISTYFGILKNCLEDIRSLPDLHRQSIKSICSSLSLFVDKLKELVNVSIQPLFNLK
jgi:hypothetical protein